MSCGGVAGQKAPCKAYSKSSAKRSSGDGSGPRFRLGRPRPRAHTRARARETQPEISSIRPFVHSFKYFGAWQRVLLNSGRAWSRSLVPLLICELEGPGAAQAERESGPLSPSSLRPGSKAYAERIRDLDDELPAGD